MKTPKAQLLAAKRWREKHPDRYRASVQRQVDRINADPALLERRRSYSKRWHSNNKVASNEAHRTWIVHNSSARIADKLRARLRYAVKFNVQDSSIVPLLGCSMTEFKERIQAQWLPGMDWLNYCETWVIDHIQPCASFDLTDPVQQARCFHWSNSQPLSRRDNQIKHSKRH